MIIKKKNLNPIIIGGENPDGSAIKQVFEAS